jgi:hypothetical protein
VAKEFLAHEREETIKKPFCKRQGMLIDAKYRFLCTFYSAKRALICLDSRFEIQISLNEHEYPPACSETQINQKLVAIENKSIAV